MSSSVWKSRISNEFQWKQTWLIKLLILGIWLSVIGWLTFNNFGDIIRRGIIIFGEPCKEAARRPSALLVISPLCCMSFHSCCQFRALFPPNLSWCGRWVTRCAQIKLLDQYFIFEIWVLIEEEFDSVSRFDVFELFNLQFAQIMQTLFLVLIEDSWDLRMVNELQKKISV